MYENTSDNDVSNRLSLDTSNDITQGSLKREFIDVTANSSIPNVDEDLDLDMIEEVSRTIRKSQYLYLGLSCSDFGGRKSSHEQKWFESDLGVP